MACVAEACLMGSRRNFREKRRWVKKLLGLVRRAKKAARRAARLPCLPKHNVGEVQRIGAVPSLPDLLR